MSLDGAVVVSITFFFKIYFLLAKVRNNSKCPEFRNLLKKKILFGFS